MTELENMPEGAALTEAMKAAYRLYQANIRATGELTYRLTKGAREGVPEKELLEIALQALDKCAFPDAPEGAEGPKNGQGAAV